MTPFKRLTGRRVAIASGCWVLLVILMYTVGVAVTARQMSVSSTGGLSAIGFDVPRVLMQLFVPPLTLVVIWLGGRLLGASSRAT
jgi:hypothetical protein